MRSNRRLATVLFTALATLLVGPVAAAQSPVASIGNGIVSKQARLVPTIPVILDGVEYAPGTLPATGARRTFVLTPAAQQRGVVYAFSSREQADALLNQTKRDGATIACSHPYNFSRFNKVRGGGGSDNLFIDFDAGTPDPPSYLSLDFGGWNNTISYVATACNSWRTILYSCRYFEWEKTVECADPEDLFLSPGIIVPDLVPYGFNNRTSSVRFG
jgi:hypothetical protein